jgi:hypothetical protein
MFVWKVPVPAFAVTVPLTTHGEVLCVTATVPETGCVAGKFETKTVPEIGCATPEAIPCTVITPEAGVPADPVPITLKLPIPAFAVTVPDTTQGEVL